MPGRSPRARLAKLLASPAAAVVVIVAVAALLRWIAARESLFGDELFTYAVTAQDSVAGFFDQIARTETNPPLSYLASWLTGAIGDSTTWIRLPSVIFGAAATVVVYRLARRSAGPKCGLLAAALIAVLPFAVFYGSEARAYGLLVFLVPLSTLVLLRALDEERPRWWAAYGALAALALYTHYTAALALALQAAWALHVQRGSWRAIVAVNALAALAFLPWFAMLDEVNNTGSLPLLDALVPPTAGRVSGASLRLVFGHPFADLEQVPGLISLVLLGGAVAIAAIALAVDRRRPSTASAPPIPDRARQERGLFALLAIGVPLVVLAYSIVDTSIYLPRNLIIVLPYLCILVAIGIVRLPRPAMLAVATPALLAAGLASVRMLADYPRPQMRAAAELIEDRAPPGTPVVEASLFGGPELGRDLDVYLSASYPLSYELTPASWPTGHDVYVVLSDRPLASQADPVAAAAGAKLVEAATFDGFDQVQVRHYRR